MQANTNDDGFRAVNPANGDEISIHPYIKDEDLDAAVATSYKAYQLQRLISYKERVEKLRTLADLLDKDASLYGRLITSQMGKPLGESTAEVKKCAKHCRYYADNADELLKPKMVKTEAKKSYVQLEALGPIYQIIPFNFPFWLTFKSAVSMILLGNTILHRNARNTPDCGLAIERLFNEAGFTNGEFINVFTDHNQTNRLIANRWVRGVSFTGSTGAGAKIAQSAGLQIKKCVMELGGSDPVVILEDADIALAAKVAVKSRLTNCGQVCIAGKRFIIHEKVYEDFLNKLVDEVRSFKLGDPMHEETHMGPMARPALLATIIDQVKRGIAAGGNVALGGGAPIADEFAKGLYYMPTIIECREGNPLLNEETFGPVFALVRGKDEDDLIRIANDSDYGLGAVVVSGDQEKGEKVARQIDAGTVYVNASVTSDSRLPSGGIKASGFGRECGEYGLAEFANIKTIWIE